MTGGAPPSKWPTMMVTEVTDRMPGFMIDRPPGVIIGTNRPRASTAYPARTSAGR